MDRYQDVAKIRNTHALLINSNRKESKVVEKRRWKEEWGSWSKEGKSWWTENKKKHARWTTNKIYIIQVNLKLC